MTNRIRLLRPDDLLCLEIEPVNLVLQNARKKWFLQRKKKSEAAFLIVHFPPQALAEQAFFEVAPAGLDNSKINKKDEYSNDPGEADLGETAFVPAGSRLSGPTRLVFRLPEDPDFQIPYTIEDLLNWDKYQLVVTPIAALDLEPTSIDITQAGATREPVQTETSIEFPYRLIISPNDTVRWGSAHSPVTHAGITELWHARLLNKSSGPSDELSTANKAPLRAVWSPDYEFEPRSITDVLLDIPPEPAPKLGQESPFRMSMNAYDRFSIVLNTTAFSGYVEDDDNSKTYKPQPFYAEQLLLSPLGAWMRSRGNWKLPTYLRHPFHFQSVPVQWNKQTRIAPLLLDNVNKYFHADQLALSPALSAFIRPGIPAADPTTSLSEWVHRATLGRDHYVRIVYEGYLYPFGHRAALIKVTERKIAKIGPDKRLYAYLKQRMFIVVREPVKDYTGLAGYNLKGLGTDFKRRMPFKNVRLTTLVTPDIMPPGSAGVNIGDFAIWVRVNNNGQADDFRFHAVAEDHSGKHIDFTAIMAFVSADSVSTVQSIVYQAYTNNPARRICPVGNQEVTYILPDAGLKLDNATFETAEMQFHSIEYLKDPAWNYRGFVPILLSANVSIPALEQLLGTKKPVTIRLLQDYLANGLSNAGKVFAELVKFKGAGNVPDAGGKLPDFDLAAENAGFSAKQAGGVSTPSFNVSCLSEKLGPLGGKTADAQNNHFDPTSFFPKTLGPKLFGEFDLADIIGLTGDLAKNAPNIIREIKDLGGGKRELKATMVWKPNISSKTIGPLSFNADDAEAEIDAIITQIVQLPPGAAPGIGETTSIFKGQITNFDLEFLEVVRLSFKLFGFESKNGEKPDMDVQLKDEDPLEFTGALTFVNELRQIIPKGLFGDGASLDLSPSGVRAGFSFAVPPVAVGVFALKDITLAAYLSLPFSDGKPTFDFAVSERHKPFVLTVAFFGGGGFFHLQVDTKGVRQLEASLEFGANAAIDLGVASGGVHFMAGIYFGMKVDTSGTSTSELTGYLRCGGEVSVMGIVSISIEFCLSFTYYIEQDKCKGKATLTISVEILFFSISVDLEIEKGFGGASGDPVFKEVMPAASDWSAYAEAFA